MSEWVGGWVGGWVCGWVGERVGSDSANMRMSKQAEAVKYLLNLFIVGCSDVLIADWVTCVVVNGEHHVELEQVHQLHKQPRCTTSSHTQVPALPWSA